MYAVAKKTGHPRLATLATRVRLDGFKKVSEEEFAQEQVDYRARFPHMKQWTLQEWIRHNRKWSVKTWAEWTSGVELDAPHSGSLG